MNYSSSVNKLISGELFYLKHKPKSILFDHLPKCAGTTINSYLKKFYPYRLTYHIKSNKEEDFVQKFLELDTRKQKKYKFIYGHRANQLIPFTDDDKIVATVMREPVDRMISNYFYVKRNVKHQFHKRVMEDDIKLEDYCATEIGGKLNNWYVHHFSGLSKAEVRQHPKEAVTVALDYIEKNYDIIGFQDQLPAFFDALQLKLGVQFMGLDEQPNKNTTNNRPMIDEVSDLTKQRISEFNKADVLLFEKVHSRASQGVVV